MVNLDTQSGVFSTLWFRVKVFQESLPSLFHFSHPHWLLKVQIPGAFCLCKYFPFLTFLPRIEISLMLSLLCGFTGKQAVLGQGS